VAARIGDALTASGAAGDEQILAAKYQVDLRAAKGVQVGDHNTRTGASIVMMTAGSWLGGSCCRP
jgi:hypothetical protein